MTVTREKVKKGPKKKTIANSGPEFESTEHDEKVCYIITPQ